LLDVESAIQTIQALLAPAVMLTAVALLLLSFNSRHSSLVNRIRLLDHEARLLRKKRRLLDIDEARLANIKEQQNLLLPRIKYVRNGILCLSFAAIFFVLTSFWIGLGYFAIPVAVTQTMIHLTFIAGMFLVLSSIVYLAIEIYLSYRIILVEVKEQI
jgi:hypothetical protein